MSILRRVLSEDLLPALRRLRPGRLASSQVPPSGRPVEPEAEPHPDHPGANPSAGLKVVILNWRSGENDPFTFVNAAIAHHLRASGKNVETVEIADATWPHRIIELARHGGIDFAYTWQGLGSPAKVGNPPLGLWDSLRTPLICIHGDHPSHMPTNHELESRYCFHLYANADHARYSNRFFRQIRGASVVEIPQLHLDERQVACAGDHFVLAKNISHPLEMESVWREHLDRETFDFYMAAAEVLRGRLAMPGYVEVHDVLDELLVDGSAAWRRLPPGSAAYHQYHGQLDHYARSVKSVRVLTLLQDFPLRVYGRGWDRFAASASALHSFHPGRDMAQSQELYYSRFGIVDISPSKGLHDRTRRAMVNGTGFLSSASLEDSFPDLERYGPLFFDFGSDSLPAKCAAVLGDPDSHRALASEFGRIYHTRYHFRHFVARIDALAKSAHVI